MKIHNLISRKTHIPHTPDTPKESESNKSAPQGVSSDVKCDKFSPEAFVSAAVNFVETKGKNTGHRFMQELNINDINRHHKSEAERLLNLSEGTALFLAFDRKAYKVDDPYVKNAGIS